MIQGTDFSKIGEIWKRRHRFENFSGAKALSGVTTAPLHCASVVGQKYKYRRKNNRSMGKDHRKNKPQENRMGFSLTGDFWRLLDILDKHGVKATVITSGLMAELFPETVVEAKKRGHEIATHHWDQTIHPTVYRTKEAERDAILKSIAAIERATGERPSG